MIVSENCRHRKLLTREDIDMRSLFNLSALMVASIIFLGCATNENRDKIWNECPVSATQKNVGEANDITLVAKENDVEELIVTSEGVELTKIESDRYDLRCDLGVFRITVLGDFLDDEAKAQLPQNLTFFACLKNSFEMNRSADDDTLWFFRSRYIPNPTACRSEFVVFDEASKKGYWAGTIQDDQKSMTLFDSTGKYAIQFFVVESNSDSWESLAERVVFKVD